jgi:hypothetical protein
LFIGLQLSHIFHPTTPIVSANLRHINSDSSAAKEFVEHTYKHLLHNNIFTKYSPLSDQADTSPAPYLLANAIDDQITRSLLARPPRPAWSEKLHQASRRVQLWKIAKSGNLNKLDISNQLQSAAAAADFNGVLPTTRLLEINQHLLQAQKALRAVRANAAEERLAFLQVLKERTALRKTLMPQRRSNALNANYTPVNNTKRFVTSWSLPTNKRLQKSLSPEPKLSSTHGPVNKWTERPRP